jgi:hypothetical protein
LDGRNAAISSYSAGTDIDGGNSGTDWIEFGFTEESLKHILNNFGCHYRKLNSIVWIYINKSNF